MKGQRRCRIHLGRPPNSGSPDGQAATAAGHAAYYAKYRAAKARGEPVVLLGGRKKRWLIPRPWRFKLSPEDEAAVLAHMAEYDRRVRGNQPRPPWQPSASTEMIAKNLESCERALVLAMNRPDPPPLETIEQVYANVREAETIVGDGGSEIRLRRLLWEIERFRRNRQQRRLELSSDRLEESNHPGEVRAANPSTREQPPMERRDEAPARSPAPPDSFRDAVRPQDAVERALEEELAHAMNQLLSLPLAESARASLDAELRRARSAAEQLQVLQRWFAAMSLTLSVAAGYIERADLRSSRRPQEDRPRSIAPWLRR